MPASRISADAAVFSRRIDRARSARARRERGEGGRPPFAGAPPARVRTVLWQYWFTDPATKRATGRWWNRKLLGLYPPEAERLPDGTITSPGNSPEPVR